MIRFGAKPVEIFFFHKSFTISFLAYITIEYPQLLNTIYNSIYLINKNHRSGWLFKGQSWPGWEFVGRVLNLINFCQIWQKKWFLFSSHSFLNFPNYRYLYYFMIFMIKPYRKHKPQHLTWLRSVTVDQIFHLWFLTFSSKKLKSTTGFWGLLLLW